MTLAAQLSADIRAKASYFPLCPLCSHIGHHDTPDILNGPSVREFHGTFRINHCCSLSNTNEHFDSKASASSWWRARRAEEHPDIATNSRRLNTLQKLEQKGLEPL